MQYDSYKGMHVRCRCAGAAAAPALRGLPAVGRGLQPAWRRRPGVGALVRGRAQRGSPPHAHGTRTAGAGAAVMSAAGAAVSAAAQREREGAGAAAAAPTPPGPAPPRPAPPQVPAARDGERQGHDGRHQEGAALLGAQLRGATGGHAAHQGACVFFGGEWGARCGARWGSGRWRVSLRPAVPCWFDAWFGWRELLGGGGSSPAACLALLLSRRAGAVALPRSCCCTRGGVCVVAWAGRRAA
jgi:hypothetical protein